MVSTFILFRVSFWCAFVDVDVYVLGVGIIRQNFNSDGYTFHENEIFHFNKKVLALIAVCTGKQTQFARDIAMSVSFFAFKHE